MLGGHFCLPTVPVSSHLQGALYEPWTKDQVSQWWTEHMNFKAIYSFEEVSLIITRSPFMTTNFIYYITITNLLSL